MSYKLITSDSWITQAWANGGGITHQLIAKRDEKGIIWRLSIARVDQECPFSIFQGIDRTIMLLSGNGFVLKFASADEHSITELFKPFSFNGENEIHCKLIKGSIRDFNIMTRRSRITPYLSINRCTFNQPQQYELSPESILFLLDGSLSVIIDNSHHLSLAKEQLLYFPENSRVTLDSTINSSIFLIVCLNENR